MSESFKGEDGIHPHTLWRMMSRDSHRTIIEGETVQFTLTVGPEEIGLQAEDVREVEDIDFSVGELEEYNRVVENLRTIRNKLACDTEYIKHYFDDKDTVFNTLNSDIEILDSSQETGQ